MIKQLLPDLKPEYVDNENIVDGAAVEKEQTESIPETTSAPTVENVVNQTQSEPLLDDFDPMMM